MHDDRWYLSQCVVESKNGVARRDSVCSYGVVHALDCQWRRVAVFSVSAAVAFAFVLPFCLKDGIVKRCGEVAEHEPGRVVQHFFVVKSKKVPLALDIRIAASPVPGHRGAAYKS